MGGGEGDSDGGGGEGDGGIDGGDGGGDGGGLGGATQSSDTVDTLEPVVWASAELTSPISQLEPREVASMATSISDPADSACTCTPEESNASFDSHPRLYLDGNSAVSPRHLLYPPSQQQPATR